MKALSLPSTVPCFLYFLLHPSSTTHTPTTLILFQITLNVQYQQPSRITELVNSKNLNLHFSTSCKIN